MTQEHQLPSILSRTSIRTNPPQPVRLARVDQPITDIEVAPPLQSRRVGDSVVLSIGGIDGLWASLVSSTPVAVLGKMRQAWTWVEAIPQVGGGWQILDDGRSGSEFRSPAFEASETPIARPGDVVWLNPGRLGIANVTTENDWGAEYFFGSPLTGNPPAYVLITGPAVSGFFPGTVSTWNAVTQLWVEGVIVWSFAVPDYGLIVSGGRYIGIQYAETTIDDDSRPTFALVGNYGPLVTIAILEKVCPITTAIDIPVFDPANDTPTYGSVLAGNPGGTAWVTTPISAIGDYMGGITGTFGV